MTTGGGISRLKSFAAAALRSTMLWTAGWVLIAFSAAHYMQSTGTAGNSLNGSSTFAFLAGFSVAGAEPGVSGERRLPRFFCEITMRPQVGSRDGHHLQTGCRIRASCKKRIKTMSICVIMNRNLRLKDTYLAMISSCFFFSSSSYHYNIGTA